MQRESAKRPSAAKLRKLSEDVARTTGGGDTKSASDLGRAKRHKKKPAYRKASREVYRAAEPKQREAVRKGGTPESAVARKQSKDFKRAEGYKREAQKFLKGKPGPEDLARVKGAERERLDKGLRVLAKQNAGDTIRRGIADYDRLRVRPTAKVEPKKQSSGIGAVADTIVEVGSRVVPSPLQQFKMAGDALKVTGQKDTVVGEAHKKLADTIGPLTKLQKEAVKGTLDGTTKALNQLNRPSSAVAGGVTDMSVKSAIKGFKENNRSFEELARKAGADGLDAEILGLAGDIAFDPTTYLTLGASAPLTAARKSAQETAQRALNAEGKRIAKLKKEGKITPDEAARHLDAAAARRRADLDRVMAKPIAKAREQRAKVDGEQPRQLQVGLRGAGRQKHVSVPVPGSQRVGKVMRNRQQARRGNDLTRRLSTKAPGKGVTRPEHDILREIDRGKRGESNALLRKAERVAFYLKKQEYTEPELRRILTAVEKDEIAKLEPRLREGATRFKSLTDEGQTRVGALLGKKVDLDERMLAPKELEGLAKQVSKVTGDKSVRKVRASDRASERDAVAFLRTAAEGAAAERLPKAVSRDVGNIIGEVRAGGAAAKEYPELAAALKAEGEGRAALSTATTPAARTAAETQVKAARASVKEHRAELAKVVEAEYAEQGLSRFKGRTGKVAAPLADAERKVAKETPKGYVPRKDDTYLRAKFGDKEAIEQVRTPVYNKAQADSEIARKKNRERRDLMDEGVGENLSIDLPLLAADYGLDVAERIYKGGVLQDAYKRFGMRPTAETFEKVGDDFAAYRRVPGKIPKRLDPDEAKALRAGEIDDVDGLFVLPKPIDDSLSAMKNAPNAEALAQDFRAAIRKWKEFQTIARPGFFVNNAVSNTWQMYLLDAKREIAAQFRIFARMKADELLERNGSRGLAKFFDKVGANKEYTLLDGKRVTTADLILEAAEHGASRTGSRLGYRLDEDLSPLEATKRQLASPKQTLRWASTKAGNLAEDMDDMVRDALYVRARTKLGMSPQEATEYVYTGMIDYGDLTEFEQRFVKVVMPFYVYTSRNVPIQVKKLMQRPGKVANFEKVVEELADISGLAPGWEQMLGEEDQERTPIPVPQGVAKAIRSLPGGSAVMPEGQSFRDLRLPVGDLRRPAQALDGPGGLVRLLKMYGGDVGPYFRAPGEVLLNRRMDYDRPIAGDGSTPTEAGSLVAAFEKIAGLDSRKTEDYARQDGKYNPTNNRVSYLLRALGGSYPSLALGVGTKGADRTGRTIGVRAADWAVGQGSIVPNVNETLLYGRLQDELDDAFDKREKLEEGSAAYYRQQDKINELKAVKAGLTKLARIRGRVGRTAEEELAAAEARDLSFSNPSTRPDVDSDGTLREIFSDRRKLKKIR